MKAPHTFIEAFMIRLLLPYTNVVIDVLRCELTRTLRDSPKNHRSRLLFINFRSALAKFITLNCLSISYSKM